MSRALSAAGPDDSAATRPFRRQRRLARGLRELPRHRRRAPDRIEAGHRLTAAQADAGFTVLGAAPAAGQDHDDDAPGAGGCCDSGGCGEEKAAPAAPAGAAPTPSLRRRGAGTDTPANA